MIDREIVMAMLSVFMVFVVFMCVFAVYYMFFVDKEYLMADEYGIIRKVKKSDVPIDKPSSNYNGSSLIGVVNENGVCYWKDWTELTNEQREYANKNINSLYLWTGNNKNCLGNFKDGVLIRGDYNLMMYVERKDLPYEISIRV